MFLTVTYSKVSSGAILSNAGAACAAMNPINSHVAATPSHAFFNRPDPFLYFAVLRPAQRRVFAAAADSDIPYSVVLVECEHVAIPQEELQRIHRDRKTQTFGEEPRLHVGDADHFTAKVEQRAAGITGIEGGGRLDEQLPVEIPARAADDALGDGPFEAEGLPMANAFWPSCNTSLDPSSRGRRRVSFGASIFSSARSLKGAIATMRTLSIFTRSSVLSSERKMVMLISCSPSMTWKFVTT